MIWGPRPVAEHTCQKNFLPEAYRQASIPVTYYAPWSNLALIYRGFGYSKGLIKLGRFDTGVEALNVQGSIKVTIEAVAD